MSLMIDSVITMCFTYSSIDIRGYNDRPISNTLYRQKRVTAQTAIVFPGLAYNCRMPLLYYTTKALIQLGYNVLAAETNYSDWAEFLEMNWDKRRNVIYSEAENIYAAAVDAGIHIDVLVGKSIGTLALGHLTESKSRINEQKFIWLTPLLKQEILYKQIQRQKPTSLFIIGTNDPHYDEQTLNEIVQTTKGVDVRVQDADHSLEVDGNVGKSLEALQLIINNIIQFIK